jgi:hypothetical protein
LKYKFEYYSGQVYMHQFELHLYYILHLNICLCLYLNNLGYTAAEARFGLRAAHGNLSTAVVYITKQREDKVEAMKKEEAETQLNRLI